MLTTEASKVMRKPGKARLRKIALTHQGLSSAKPFGSGVAAVAKAVEHLGYVQIDTISVVERAHHHVLWSRIPGYQPDALYQLVASKKIFEYWFHAAAYLPIRDFRYALPRMHAIKSGEKHWFDNINKRLLRDVYRRIESEGPLRARDFADATKKTNGWWDWKPAKRALEQLFMQGDLMVVGREGFQKRYDLTERVLSDHVDTSYPDLNEQAEFLVNTTLRAHGFASLKSFTYLRKGKDLRLAVKEYLNACHDQQKIDLIDTSSGERFFVDSKLLDEKRRSLKRVKLLSPFDNLVIQRERCREVFDFDYQIECYVPAPKRKYGYFCLPLLYADKLVGRMDCKADRKSTTLRVIHLQHDIEDDEFLCCLAAEITRFMKFNQCNDVVVEHARTATIKNKLQRSIQY